MTDPAASPRPIFIIGATRRTGTNYLFDLLRLHPGCTTALPIWEDYLLARAHHLENYVDDVVRAWTPSWGVPAARRDDLLRHLGDGIVSFLDAGDGRRVVTKTPRADNLDLFFDLFPGTPLLVLHRDGRSVVESSVRSGFNRTYEAAMRDWSSAARVVLDFDERHRQRQLPYRLVSYDRLVADLDAELRGILDFLGLDADRYDFDAAAALPVRGSSTVRSDAIQEVHWAPVERSVDFRPLERWHSWDPWLHDRFRRIAGREQLALGYDLSGDEADSPIRSARHAASDAAWTALRVRRRLVELRRSVRRHGGAQDAVINRSYDAMTSDVEPSKE